MRKSKTTAALILAFIIMALCCYNIAKGQDTIEEKKNWHEQGYFEDSIGTNYPYKKLLIFADKSKPVKQVWSVWKWNGDVEKKIKKEHKVKPFLKDK